MYKEEIIEEQVIETIQSEHGHDKNSPTCTNYLRSIHDTLDIISGKWKVTIIGSLGFGKKRFMELQRVIDGIGPKMLSKELQELEINGLVTRSVMDTKPVTVEYELTGYGRTLKPIIDEMASWGGLHRQKVIKIKVRLCRHVFYNTGYFVVFVLINHGNVFANYIGAVKIFLSSALTYYYGVRFG